MRRAGGSRRVKVRRLTDSTLSHYLPFRILDSAVLLWLKSSNSFETSGYRFLDRVLGLILCLAIGTMITFLCVLLIPSPISHEWRSEKPRWTCLACLPRMLSARILQTGGSIDY